MKTQSQFYPNVAKLSYLQENENTVHNERNSKEQGRLSLCPKTAHLSPLMSVSTMGTRSGSVTSVYLSHRSRPSAG